MQIIIDLLSEINEIYATVQVITPSIVWKQMLLSYWYQRVYFCLFVFSEAVIRSNLSVFSTVLHLTKSALKHVFLQTRLHLGDYLLLKLCSDVSKPSFKSRILFKPQYIVLKSFQSSQHFKKSWIPGMGSGVLTAFHTLLIFWCSLIYTLGSLVSLFFFICTFKLSNSASLSLQSCLWYCCVWNDPVYSLMSAC